MSTLPAAIVTGASRGIGRAIALQLASEGHSVLVNYVTSQGPAEEVAQAVRDLGVAAMTVQGDVGNSADRQKLIDTALAEFGRIDVLVNNAGVTSQGRKDLLDATEESWDLVFNTNLKGPFFLCQLAAQSMIDSIAKGTIERGTIVNISSISAYAVSTNRADYCMAKTAMSTMTQLFAARLAEEKIGVFEVCPGVIATDMTSGVREKYEKLIAEGLTPIQRFGTPEDVALAVAALVRGLFPFSTGERFNVDGGFHIRRL